MRIRKEEKTTIIQGAIGFVVTLTVILLSKYNDIITSMDATSIVHLLTALVCIAVCCTIFAQGWMLFSKEISRQRLYSTILFIVIGILDIYYIGSYSSIYFFGSEPGINASLSLLLISHALCATAMVVIFSSRDKHTEPSYKFPTFVTFALPSFACLFLIYSYQYELPLLLNAESIASWKQMVLIGIPLLYGFALIAIVYPHHRKRPLATLTAVRALIFMILGHFLLILNYPEGHGYQEFLGQVFMAIAYYCVLRGVYRLTIEEPFRYQQQTEAQIKYMAFHDDLTGLPNRRRLKERLEEYLGSSNETELGTAVIIVNINRFKAINDSLGYSAGDRMIRVIGDRLVAHCSPVEQVFRMGEDEFAVIMPGVAQFSEVQLRASTLLLLLEPSVKIEDTEYHISLSFGLALYPEDGETAEQLIQNADMAVHNAKEQGFEMSRYAKSMQVKAQNSLKLENDMRKGLERQEFFLEYQPQIHLDSGEVVGMEALVRWNHPERGLISPGEFIPLAEESGLIVPLGEWVLRTACRDNKDWQNKGYRPVCVSVNLSMRQFRQAHLPELVSGILDSVGLDANFLELEITESMTFDKETAFEQLKRLKQLGVHISIDDFGTGYSSLHYLKSLPIDRLKIDRSFVKEVMLDGNDAAIVSTIASMAHHLKLKVTAEGVENMEQLEFLKLQRCHEGQGFLFSKPVLPEDFEQRFLLREIV